MLRKLLSITLLAAFLGWVAWYVSTNTQAFRPLTEVSYRDGLTLTLAFLAIMVCNGVFIAIVSQAFQIRLFALEWLSLSFASSFTNYFLPFKGGVGIRTLYMSRRHGFPISKFVSTLGVMYLMNIVVNGLLALIGMGIIIANDGPANVGLLIFFALVAMAGIIAMVINVDIGSHHERFPMAQLGRLLAAWRTVRRNRTLLVKLWLLMLGLTLATIWQCRVAFDAVSITLPWSGVLVYAASKNLATLISLTPGSLGVVELISIYLGRILDYSTANALLVQGLIRAVAIIVLLLIGPVSLMFLRRNLNSASDLNSGKSDA